MDTQTEQTPQLMTVKEVAELLGITDRAVYGRVARKEIPHIKLGNLLRFNRAEILAWLKDNSVKPAS